MVAVRRLTLTDFRNYGHLLLRVEPACVVLTGANGAGKTNLLEAISLFSPGRGLRRANLGACAREGGEGGWAVAAEIAGPDGPVRLGTGLAADATQRQCRIDGAPTSGPAAFAEHLRVIWLTPAMDRLFSGPAGDRRRFLDRMVASVEGEHTRRLGAYNRAMAERNRLLSLPRSEHAWLDALEVQMAETGVAMAVARVAALERLARLVDEGAAADPFPPARLAVAGELEEAVDHEPATDIEDRFRATLAAMRPRDRAAGRALSGPHTSDLSATHGLTGMAAERCSTGEQKALLISIVLAQARLAAAMHAGAAPVLLLDEVTAHLDEPRREALFGAIEALGAQTWMTGTDARLFDPLRGSATFVTVDRGQATVA